MAGPPETTHQTAVKLEAPTARGLKHPCLQMATAKRRTFMEGMMTQRTPSLSSMASRACMEGSHGASQ